MLVARAGDELDVAEPAADDRAELSQDRITDRLPLLGFIPGIGRALDAAVGRAIHGAVDAVDCEAAPLLLVLVDPRAAPRALEIPAVGDRQGRRHTPADVRVRPRHAAASNATKIAVGKLMGADPTGRDG